MTWVWLAAGLWLAPAEDPVDVRVPPPEPGAVDLRWSAPAPCPDRDGVLEALRELAGRHLVLDDDASLYVEGLVDATDDGFALQLYLRSAAGIERRELRDADCGAVVQAASVVVLTRLLPDDDTTTPVRSPVPDDAPADGEPEPDPDPGPSDDPVAPPDEPLPAAEDSTAVPRWRVGLQVLGGVAVGLGPDVAPTVRVGVAALGPSFRFQAYALHAFAGFHRGPDGLVIRVSHSGGGVLGCWAPVLGTLDFPLCTGVAVAAVRGEGAGSAVASQPSTQLWLGVPIEIGLTWAPMRRVALLARAGGVAALRRPGFHIDDRGREVLVARAWPFGVTGSLGVEIRLP